VARDRRRHDRKKNSPRTSNDAILPEEKTRKETNINNLHWIKAGRTKNSNGSDPGETKETKLAQKG
jgi:hypothetical protein